VLQTKNLAGEWTVVRKGRGIGGTGLEGWKDCRFKGSGKQTNGRQEKAGAQRGWIAALRG